MNDSCEISDKDIGPAVASFNSGDCGGAASGGECAALVAEAPLRVEAFYPEKTGGVFPPGKEAELRVRVVNPSKGIIPLEVRFAAPDGWSLLRGGTDVEHAFGPGEAHEETLAITAPSNCSQPSPGLRGELLLKLRCGCLEWAVPIALPLSSV